MDVRKKVSDRESLQHLMTCCICLDTLKKPVILPCIHHFCKHCKSQLNQEVQNGIEGIVCPKCRRFTSHDSIKDDFVMEQIVALHTSKDADMMGGKECCELCLSETSTVKCLECKIKMCESCKIIHLRTPYSRGHRLKDLNEIKEEKVIDAVVFCTEHSDKLIEFSCVNCKKAICYKCKILHHDGHKTETVEDAIDRLMSDVHSKLEPVDTEIESLQKKIKHLEDTDQLTGKWEHDTISEINSQKLELIRRIERDSEALIEEVKAKAEATKKDLHIQKTDAEHLLSSKESTRSWVNTMVSHLGDVNLLLQLQGDVMTTLNKQDYHQFTSSIKSAPDEKFDKYKLAVEGNIVGVLKTNRLVADAWFEGSFQQLYNTDQPQQINRSPKNSSFQQLYNTDQPQQINRSPKNSSFQQLYNTDQPQQINRSPKNSSFQQLYNTDQPQQINRSPKNRYPANPYMTTSSSEGEDVLSTPADLFTKSNYSTARPNSASKSGKPKIKVSQRKTRYKPE